jgi:hypothetical protein
VFVGVQIDGVVDLADPCMRTAENKVLFAHPSRLRSRRQLVHRRSDEADSNAGHGSSKSR